MNSQYLTTRKYGSGPYLFMVASAFAFAIMGVLSHMTYGRVSWQVLAVARTSIAFVLSLILCLSLKIRLVLFRPRILWMRSIAGSFGILCLFYALPRLPVSTVLTLANTVPVWVTLLAWPMLGRHPSKQTWIAISLGLLGVVLIQNPQATGDPIAGLLALGNALCTAVAMIGLNKLSHIDSNAVVTHFSGVSCVFTVTVLLLSGGQIDYWSVLVMSNVFLLIGVGVSGLFAQMTMTRAFALGDPARVSVLALMQIVFAVPFDILIWRRHFGPLTVVGMVLILAPSGWLMIHNPLKGSDQLAPIL
jgi:drug/metabolite transporter (DMT)-like permease